MQNIDQLKRLYDMLDELCRSDFMLGLLNGPDVEILETPSKYTAKYLEERQAFGLPELSDSDLAELCDFAIDMNKHWSEDKHQVISWREFAMTLVKQRDILKCVLISFDLEKKCNELK